MVKILKKAIKNCNLKNSRKSLGNGSETVLCPIMTVKLIWKQDKFWKKKCLETAPKWLSSCSETAPKLLRNEYCSWFDFWPTVTLWSSMMCLDICLFTDGMYHNDRSINRSWRRVSITVCSILLATVEPESSLMKSDPYPIIHSTVLVVTSR